VSIPIEEMDKIALKWVEYRQLDDSDLVKVVNERYEQPEVPVDIDDL
jgi:hypothetical protein